MIFGTGGRKNCTGIGRPDRSGLTPDRSIFRGKRCLPIGLVEASRGCHCRGEFYAFQSAFNQSLTRRPTAGIIDEIQAVWSNRLAEPPRYLELAAW